MRNGFGENEEWPRQRPRTRRRHKEQIDRNPYARVISSLETNLKEAQVIKTFAMEEITGLKTDLISWIEKWNLLREKKLKYKDQVKKLMLRNRRLIKQSKIAKIRAVRFKANLDEVRRNVPIRLSVESALKI